MQFRRFNRREFITLVGSGAASWPLSASAQQIGRVWRIGVLVAEPWPEVEGLHDGLRELGYRDGENVLLEYRFANGDAGRFPALVTELIRLPVDAIVTWGTPATLAAMKATSSIPIIMSAGDPVGAGLVASLGRPGANVTGFSSQSAGGRKNE
jgi:putative ABC transport system substrate-binding protein